MSSIRLFGLLKREPAASTPRTLRDVLQGRGVSEEVLEEACHQRFVLRTRMLSTLVAQGELDDTVALEVLCQHLGYPGICVNRSVVNLGLSQLDEAWSRRHRVLPIHPRAGGDLVVAFADPPNDALLQETQCRLGGPVHPHVALHAALIRTMDAVFELRQECPDALYLLGDDVESANIDVAAEHAVSRLPTAAMPRSHREETPEAARMPQALLAMAHGEHRDAIEARLNSGGMEVLAVDDGPSALRLLVAEKPAVIIMAAQLAGRSGVEILQQLGSAERFRIRPKILLTDNPSPQLALYLQSVANLKIESSHEFDANLDTLLEGLEAVSRFDDEATMSQAQGFLSRVLSFHDSDEPSRASETLAVALDLDPLLPGAHRIVAEQAHSAGQWHRAAQAYALLMDLGAAQAADVANFAEVAQHRGYLKYAGRLWAEAARLFEDRDISRALKEHAAVLGHNDAEHER